MDELREQAPEGEAAGTPAGDPGKKENGLGRQGIWYLIAGGSSALIELGLFQLLYAVFGVDLAVSNIVAVVVATAFNFLVNRNVTFKSTSNPARSLALYLILFFANLAITTLVIGWLVGLGVHSAVAKVCMQVAVACWNFVLYRKVIFR